jgi:Ca-activated chloride channel homolog
MKARNVGILSAVGMLLTSVTVYSFVPPGGSGWKKAGIEATPEGGGGIGALLDGKQSGAKFLAGGAALMVEGKLGHADIRADQSTDQLVMLEVFPNETRSATKRAAVSLGIVIDRSGSMSGTRIQNAIKAALGAVDRLQDGDSVTVITFDHETQTVVRPTTIGASSRQSVRQAIQGITLGGNTCISCGLEQALVELGIGGSRPTDAGVSTILLLSDGDANHGVRDVTGFRALGARAREKGVSITSIGVDLEYNEKLLSAVSRESNGRHHFVRSDADLARVFEEETSRLTSSVAAGVEAEIELPAGVELVRVFDRTFRREGQKIIVPLGSFGTGERKTVLAEVRVGAGQKGLRDVANVSLKWNDLVTANAGSCSGRLVAQAGEVTSTMDADVLLRLQKSGTGDALREANRLFDEGKADEARAALRKARASVAEAAKAAPMASAGLGAQDKALGEAEDNFATPAPNAAPPAAAQAQRKANVQKADAFGF